MRHTTSYEKKKKKCSNIILLIIKYNIHYIIYGKTVVTREKIYKYIFI